MILLAPILAFSLGIFVPTEKRMLNPQIIKAQVKDPGEPLEFKIEVRTKANKADEWIYLPVDSYSVNPSRLMSSPLGRLVTIRLPSQGLMRYSQVCAAFEPKADPDRQFQVLMSLKSCQNVPKANLAALLKAQQ